MNVSMKIFTEEWRRALDALMEPLRAFVDRDRFEMGSVAYKNNGRSVTVKHRLRKDRVGVETIACWRDPDNPEDPHKVDWIKTIATPSIPEAEEISAQLVEYLKTGELPSVTLTTYPGYEEMDAQLRHQDN